MVGRKRRDVTFTKDSVTLDGTTYTVAGCESDTFFRLALEGLAARLKRSKEPNETYSWIVNQGIRAARPKRDPWVEAWAAAGSMSVDVAAERWEGLTKEKRDIIRRHPAVYAAKHRESTPIEELFK